MEQRDDQRAAIKLRSYIQTRPQPPPIEIDYCDDDDDDGGDGDDDDNYFHKVENKPLVVWLLQNFQT